MKITPNRRKISLHNCCVFYAERNTFYASVLCSRKFASGIDRIICPHQKWDNSDQ